MNPIKRAMVYSLFATGVIFGGTSSIAMDQHGNYQVYGNLPCSVYLNNLKQGGLRQMSMKAYVAGFVSGVNLISPETYDVLGQSNVDGALLWLKNYCEKNPLEKLGKPMAELMAELYPKRNQMKP